MGKRQYSVKKGKSSEQMLRDRAREIRSSCEGPYGLAAYVLRVARALDVTLVPEQGGATFEVDGRSELLELPEETAPSGGRPASREQLEELEQDGRVRERLEELTRMGPAAERAARNAKEQLEEQAAELRARAEQEQLCEGRRKAREAAELEHELEQAARDAALLSVLGPGDVPALKAAGALPASFGVNVQTRAEELVAAAEHELEHGTEKHSDCPGCRAEHEAEHGAGCRSCFEELVPAGRGAAEFEPDYLSSSDYQRDLEG